MSTKLTETPRTNEMREYFKTHSAYPTLNKLFDLCDELESALSAAEQRATDAEADVTRLHDSLNKEADARIEAEQRAEAMGRDVRRYEWLKDQQRMAYGDTATINWNVGHDWQRINSESLDSAIDAAIASGAGEAGNAA